MKNLKTIIKIKSLLVKTLFYCIDRNSRNQIIILITYLYDYQRYINASEGKNK
jgi:hypothetical protein